MATIDMIPTVNGKRGF